MTPSDSPVPSLASSPGRGRTHLALCAVAPAALLLSGCQAVVNTTSSSQVRVIDASPDAPGLDMYINSGLLVPNLGFGTVTSYVAVNAGNATITADTAGSTQVLASAKNTFVNSNQYTVLISNDAADLQQVVLKDQAQPAPSGQISFRFIDEATKVGALDVYLVPQGQKFTAVTPFLQNITFGTVQNYVSAPTGTYTIVIVPTGTIPTGTTVATYTGALIPYSGGAVTTIILVDQQLVTTPGLQVISATDYTPPSPASS